MRMTTALNMTGLGPALAIALLALAALSTPAWGGGGVSGKCDDIGGIVAEWEEDLAEELADIEEGVGEVDDVDELDELEDDDMGEAMMAAAEAEADHAERVAKLQGDCMKK